MTAGAALLFAACAQASISTASPEGLQFSCESGPRAAVMRDMRTLFDDLHLSGKLVDIRNDPESGSVTYTLKTVVKAEGTLDFARKPHLWVYDELVLLPAAGGRTREAPTVSRKEVLLALLSPGRLTTFSGEHCSVEALDEHVRLRQHVVAWAQNLSWGWPDGGSASWNPKFWRNGTPRSRALTRSALLDALVDQNKYGVGCYTAAKMVYAGAIVDFYSRVRPNRHKLQRILSTLWSDGDPLVAVEPAQMWSFEPDFDPHLAAQRPGKLLELSLAVAERNFVPGDWAYFLNTDPHTYAKTGYEGSNAIYLGRGRFSDYYNDNEHAYSFEQKLDEVFQWRNGVFSRSRHHDRAEALSPDQLAALARSPSNGGLLVPVRAVPRLW